MTSLTYSQARDDILKVVNDAWTPTNLPMVWEDVSGELPENDETWARTILTHVSGEQSSLSHALGQQKYTRNGILTIQIFTFVGNGLSFLDNFVKVIVDAFEGKTSSQGVCFRNVSVNEIGSDGSYFQVNVLIDFEYYEIK